MKSNSTPTNKIIRQPACSRLTLNIFALLLASLASSGCAASWPARANYRPLVISSSPLHTATGACVTFEKGVDARVGLKHIGHFDPNNVEPMSEFKIERTVTDEIAYNLEKLLLSYGIRHTTECDTALKITVLEFSLTGRRRFGQTTFTAGVAFTADVIDRQREETLGQRPFGGKASTSGSADGSQDAYYNAALTNALARAMEQVAADVAFANLLVSQR